MPRPPVPAPSPVRRLATVHVAAEYLDCSETTMWRRIADGTLPAYRLGPSIVRVDLNEIDAALLPMPSAATPTHARQR